MRTLRTLCVAFLLLTADAASARDSALGLADYSLKSWLEDEAPFPFGVYAISQDRAGYLLLGTRSGIVRFDGTTFSVWKGSAELLDDRISKIFAAADGTLWVGYGIASGVTRIVDGVVTNFSMADGLSSGAVSELLQDAEGAIWASTYAGVSRFQKDRWQRFGPEQGLPAASIRGLFIDGQHNLLVATPSGVYRMATGESRFTLFSSSNGRQFAEDPSGTVWITDPNDGMRALEGRRHSQSPWIHRKGAQGVVLLNDRSGALWLGTRGHGVMRVRGLGGDPKQVTADYLTSTDGLPTNEIRSLFEDRDGTIWIGTRLGLSRLSESNIQAAPISPAQDAFVEAVITTKDGSVWTGTADGLHRRSPTGERTYSTEQGLPGRVVSALHEDVGGTLWVATTQGIARLNGERFVAVPGSSGVMLQNVGAMTSDRKGALWLCDQQGVFTWRNGSLTRVDVGTLEGPPYTAFTDSADRVWIGFWIGGVTVFDGERTTSYSTDQGLPSGTVNVIYEDRGGTLWVGTSRGVARFDGQRFRTLEENGFPRSAVVSIIDDDLGNLWFGLASGLLRIAREEFTSLDEGRDTTLAYRIYGIEDGLPGTLGRPGTPSSARTRGGQLWFVTSQRLAVVDPQHLAVSPGPGPLRIDELIADGHVHAPDAELRFGPKLSRIQIGYATLSLSASAKPRFRYKLENFDSDWQEAGDRRQASYTNLPPGRYRFKVVSNDAAGGWHESGAEVAFAVLPAFYQTYSFYLAAGGLLAIGVWTAWRLRVRRLRTHFNLVLAERVRMGREIHDTLLQSLVGVALEFDDISEQLDPRAESLNTQVRRVRQQVEHYIREARQSIWNLRSPSLNASDLVAALRHFGEAAVHGHDACFQMRVAGIVRRGPSRIEEQLLRIGQEAISNAVRHSGANLITAELGYSSDAISLRIEDDGCGFDPEQVDQPGDVHWGLISMRERAQQIGAKFTLQSRRGAGTVIEAKAALPVQHEAAEATHPYSVRRRSSSGA